MCRSDIKWVPLRKIKLFDDSKLLTDTIKCLLREEFLVNGTINNVFIIFYILYSIISTAVNNSDTVEQLLPRLNVAQLKEFAKMYKVRTTDAMKTSLIAVLLHASRQRNVFGKNVGEQMKQKCVHWSNGNYM